MDNVTRQSLDGAPQRYLARIGNFTVGLDVKGFLKESKVIVHQVLIDDADANLYMARDGSTNFDHLPHVRRHHQGESSLPKPIDRRK